jgi:uncharacterized protein (TIGR03085 family)
MSVAEVERQQLCDLFEDLGPSAPTLNEGWQTADLAAHLLVREHRPDALPGLVLAAAHRWTARLERRAKEHGDYGAMVRRLRQGAPPWSVFALPGLADRTGLHEWFVHHEDVRRANGMGPRDDSAAQRRLDDAVWRILPTWGPVLAHRVDADVVLVADDGRRRRIRRNGPRVEVHGRPSELLLELFDRRSVAAVETIGDDDGVARWRAAKLGL